MRRIGQISRRILSYQEIYGRKWEQNRKNHPKILKRENILYKSEKLHYGTNFLNLHEYDWVSIAI